MGASLFLGVVSAILYIVSRLAPWDSFILSVC